MSVEKHVLGAPDPALRRVLVRHGRTRSLVTTGVVLVERDGENGPEIVVRSGSSNERTFVLADVDVSEISW